MGRSSHLINPTNLAGVSEVFILEWSEPVDGRSRSRRTALWWRCWVILGMLINNLVSMVFVDGLLDLGGLLDLLAIHL